MRTAEQLRRRLAAVDAAHAQAVPPRPGVRFKVHRNPRRLRSRWLRVLASDVGWVTIASQHGGEL